MGGEPTFVSRERMDEPEWGVEALGGNKHELAIELADRLAHDFAPDALIMHTQGKWYPGEPLPRWQIGIWWRTDGRPLWRDPALLDAPTNNGEPHRCRRRAAGERTDRGAGAQPGREAAGRLRARGRTRVVSTASPTATCCRCTVTRVTPGGRVSAGTRQHRRVTLLHGDGPIGARLPLDELTEVDEDEAAAAADGGDRQRARRSHPRLPAAADRVRARGGAAGRAAADGGAAADERDRRGLPAAG